MKYLDTEVEIKVQIFLRIEGKKEICLNKKPNTRNKKIIQTKLQYRIYQVRQKGYRSLKWYDSWVELNT